MLDKIRELINDADVILADCSGSNANVFYELGIAHALKKRVILITRDSIKDAPSDIRHFEFIHYETSNHLPFLERLDNALNQLLFEVHEPLFSQALGIPRRFVESTQHDARPVDKTAFLSKVRVAERERGLPASNDEKALTRFLLPIIVEDSSDATTMGVIAQWIDQANSTPS